MLLCWFLSQIWNMVLASKNLYIEIIYGKNKWDFILHSVLLWKQWIYIYTLYFFKVLITIYTYTYTHINLNKLLFIVHIRILKIIYFILAFRLSHNWNGKNIVMNQEGPTSWSKFSGIDNLENNSVILFL